MSNIVFSFILPVYNTSEYLESCVTSVLEITEPYRESCEIILVDDGSTDSSGSLCDLLASKAAGSVRCIHKENGGLSDARNCGIDASIGEWLLFVDSDDYLDRNFASCLPAIADSHDVDMFFLRADKLFSDGRTERLDQKLDSKKISNGSMTEVLKYIAIQEKLPASACTKAVRRSFLIDNNLFFEKGLISEDVDWMIRVLLAKGRYACMDNRYYLYRQGRFGSITSSVSEKTIDSLLNILQNYSTQNAAFGTEAAYINAILSYEYLVLLGDSFLVDHIDKNHLSRIYSFGWLLDYGISKKVKIVKTISRFLGLRGTRWLLGKFLAWRR